MMMSICKQVSEGVCVQSISALQLPHWMVFTLVSKKLTLLKKKMLTPHRYWYRFSLSDCDRIFPFLLRHSSSLHLCLCFQTWERVAKEKIKWQWYENVLIHFYVLCNNFEERYPSSHISFPSFIYNNKWVFFSIKLIKTQWIRVVLQVVMEAIRINFLF